MTKQHQQSALSSHSFAKDAREWGTQHSDPTLSQKTRKSGAPGTQLPLFRKGRERVGHPAWLRMTGQKRTTEDIEVQSGDSNGKCAELESGCVLVFARDLRADSERDRHSHNAVVMGAGGGGRGPVGIADEGAHFFEETAATEQF